MSLNELNKQNLNSPEQVMMAYQLPDLEGIVKMLGFTESQLDEEVGYFDDLMPAEKWPAKFISVRTIREVVEDEYDDFLEQLGSGALTETNPDVLLGKFRSQLRLTWRKLLVVTNNGNAYVAEKTKAMPVFKDGKQ